MEYEEWPWSGSEVTSVTENNLSLLFSCIPISILWNSTIVNSVFIKQKKAIILVTRATDNEHCSPLFKQLNLFKL